MRPLLPVTLVRNVLVPGWIMAFGFLLLTAPALTVPASLSLLGVGLFVVPALMLMGRPEPGRATLRRREGL